MATPARFIVMQPGTALVAVWLDSPLSGDLQFRMLASFLNAPRIAVLTLGGGSLLYPLGANASEASSPEELRIYGGEPAKTCEWPTSVGLGRCTGTLVHPRIMLSAAHCSTPSKVQFGEAYGKSIVKTVKIDWCEKNPDFKMKEGDFAFCYLKEAVTDVPIAPIAYGCEVEEIKEGAKIWLVGFGSREDGGSGTKYKVEIPINKVMSDGQEIEVGGDGKASCYGDSGGPAFMKLSDGSWRTVGIVSRGTNKECGYPSVLTTAHSAVPWIQKTLKEKGVTDVDIAPCFDDDGKWDPTDACTGFAIDPGAANGSWDDMCSGEGSKSGKSTICAPEGEKGKGDGEKDGGDSKKEGEPSDKPEDSSGGENPEEGENSQDEDSASAGGEKESDADGSQEGSDGAEGSQQSDAGSPAEDKTKEGGSAKAKEDGSKDGGCSLAAGKGPGAVFCSFLIGAVVSLARRRRAR